MTNLQGPQAGGGNIFKPVDTGIGHPGVGPVLDNNNSALPNTDPSYQLLYYLVARRWSQLVPPPTALGWATSPGSAPTPRAATTTDPRRCRGREQCRPRSTFHYFATTSTLDQKLAHTLAIVPTANTRQR